MLRLLVIVAIASMAVSVTTMGTLAFFTDTESVNANEFLAGTVDIAVDGNNGIVGIGGVVCLGLGATTFKTQTAETPTDCALKPSQFGLIKFRIDNVGDNPVDVLKRITNVSSLNNGWSEPECDTVPGTFVAPDRCDVGETIVEVADEAACTGLGGTIVDPGATPLLCTVPAGAAPEDPNRLPPLMDFDLTVVTAARQIVADESECTTLLGWFTEGDSAATPPIPNTCLVPGTPNVIIGADTSSAVPLLGDAATGGTSPDLTRCSLYLGEIPPGGAMTVIQSFHLNESLGNEGQTDLMTFDETYEAIQINAPNPGTSPTAICSVGL